MVPSSNHNCRRPSVNEQVAQHADQKGRNGTPATYEGDPPHMQRGDPRVAHYGASSSHGFVPRNPSNYGARS